MVVYKVVCEVVERKVDFVLNVEIDNIIDVIVVK